jgi:protein-arginine kinase activator protein McsA
VENLEHEFQNVSGILLSIVNAVTVVNDKLSSTYSNVHQYVYYEEGQLKNGILQIDDPFNQTFSSLLSNVKQEEVNNSGIMQQTIVYEKDETISARHLKMKLRIPDKSIYYEVEAFEKAAILRNQIRRLLHLKDSFPNIPEDDVFDRGIKESEILSFTSLSIQDFHRFNQLRIFEDFLKDVNESIPNFTGLLKLQQGSDRSVLKRQHSRQLSASIFSKILSYELNHSDPKVLLRYYPLTDQLLYALCWPPPTRRHVRSTVTLPDYFNMENSRVPSSTKQKKSNISSRASSPTDDVAEKLTVVQFDVHLKINDIPIILIMIGEAGQRFG